MSRHESAHDALSTIPIIDFSKWSDASPTVQRSTAKSLASALQSIGFVNIINHGLSQSLLDEAFATSKRLFSLTLDQKMQAPHPPGPDIHRGYSSPGLEKVSQYTGGDTAVGEALRAVLDFKESYEVGSEHNTAQPNIWLPESTLPGFKSFALHFYHECDRVAKEILRAITVGLELEKEDAGILMQAHSGLNNQLRLLHYPAVAAEELEQGRTARIGAHSDWGSFTMLFQDDCGGLEVEDPNAAGRFLHVMPVPGACVVNVGDLLMRWTNGESACQHGSRKC